MASSFIWVCVASYQRHQVSSLLVILRCRNIPVSLIELESDRFALFRIPLPSVFPEKVSVELFKHVLLEVLDFRQYVELLAANRTLRFVERACRRVQYAKIRFRHVG